MDRGILTAREERQGMTVREVLIWIGIGAGVVGALAVLRYEPRAPKRMPGPEPGMAVGGYPILP